MTLNLNKCRFRRGPLYLWRAGAAPALLWRGRCGLCVPVWPLQSRPGDPGRRGPILGGILRLRRMRGPASWTRLRDVGNRGDGDGDAVGARTAGARGKCRRDGRDAGCRGIRDRAGEARASRITAGTGWWMLPLDLIDRVCGHRWHFVWVDVNGGLCIFRVQAMLRFDFVYSIPICSCAS
jgi:hypothetical protein